MVLSLSHTGTAKLGSRLTGHLGSFHGHTGIARAAQGVWRKKKHSCFALRGQAVRSHLVWDIISGQESLGSLAGFDRKGLKDFGRQNLRRAPSPPRSWNTGQAVGAECCVCTQGPSPCQGSSTAPDSHKVAPLAQSLAGLGGAVLRPSPSRGPL